MLGFRDLRVEKVLFVQNVLFLGKRRRADALDSLSLLVDSSGKGKKRDISGAAITLRRPIKSLRLRVPRSKLSRLASQISMGNRNK